MARVGSLRMPEGTPVRDVMDVGVLTRWIPPEKVHEALRETGRASQRERDLPAHVMMYYAVAQSVFRSEGSREVLRLLLQGVKERLGLAVKVEPAGKSAISQAKSRLGVEPVEWLYRELAKPIATEQTQGAWYRGWRTVAVDGSTLEVPDTPCNEEAFGRPYSERGESAYPRVRVVGLAETGTHVCFGAEVGPYYTSEVTLAHKVVKRLEPGMLCLADRYLYGYELWTEASSTGSDLLWRVRGNIRLPVKKELPDGSYLSRIYPKRVKGKPRGKGTVVRVIEYRVRNPEGKMELYRLITTILDPKAAPAEELAQLYRERWEFETMLDETKTHMRGARTVLRSLTPELVRQECYGLLLAHFALRGLMHEAALKGKRDPDRISFIHTVRVVRRHLPHFAALPPSGLEKPARGGAAGDPGRGRGAAASQERQARSQAQAEQVPGPTAKREVAARSAADVGVEAAGAPA